jgi:hypothetical protein
MGVSSNGCGLGMASARQWRQASMQAWVISQYTSMGFRAKSYRLEFMVAEGE